MFKNLVFIPDKLFTKDLIVLWVHFFKYKVLSFNRFIRNTLISKKIFIFSYNKFNLISFLTRIMVIETGQIRKVGN